MPVNEQAFQAWYAPLAARMRLDPDPDNPLHFYDYRAAYLSGARPDRTGHWPSQFKRLGHPNLIVNGIDTRNGLRAALSLMQQNERENARVRSMLR
jgi:hypothetical protein